jgi:hypothetical protein
MLAAAKRCVSRRVALECSPGMGRQLPLVPAFFPATGSNPGQQCAFFLVPREAVCLGALRVLAPPTVLRVARDRDFRSMAILG